MLSCRVWVVLPPVLRAIVRLSLHHHPLLRGGCTASILTSPRLASSLTCTIGISCLSVDRSSCSRFFIPIFIFFTRKANRCNPSCGCSLRLSFSHFLVAHPHCFQLLAPMTRIAQFLFVCLLLVAAGYPLVNIRLAAESLSLSFTSRVSER